jgi:alpha-glucosidase (family GH31 glycosyl hydrolase)
MSKRGVSAMVLGSEPCELSRFYRAGGEDAPITPTAALVSATAEGLQVRFLCTEPNPRYRPVSRKEGLQNPALQNSVAVQVRPDWNQTTVYYVALALSREHFGLRFPACPMPEGKIPEPVTGYVTRQDTQDGIVRCDIVIPWVVLGGRPANTFGLNVLRARAQSSEYLSPIALDHTHDIAPDLFMEVSFGDHPRMIVLEETLARLPSGVPRWQRPAVLDWPDSEERGAIWNMQQELSVPTTPESLARRVHLCQRWLDLLILEGFSFHTEGGCWTEGKGEYRPERARMMVNEALLTGNTAEACRVLDVFLGQLDRASRTWFADGSPGNIRADWAPLETITGMSCTGMEIRLQGVAGGHAVNLHVSSPLPGCLRVHAEPKGFFDAPPSGTLSCTTAAGCMTARFGDLTVEIRQAPWSLAIMDGKRERWRMAQGDLAFLFNGDGAVCAVDMQKPLADDEDVYGFGERFDALNQRGRVITVHDLDAWEGTIYGLRNQQYKPIQLFHNTAGTTTFLNSTYRLRADVGQGAADRLRLTQAGPIFDLYVWTCDPMEAVKGYTDLTGKPVLPPKWVFEPWMGGGWGRWKHGPLGEPTAEMLGVAARFAALDIPHSAIYAEGEGSSDPRLFTALAPQGIRPLTWMNSNMGLKSQRELLPEVPESELPIVRRRNGTVFPYVDFTHPRAMELLRAYWRRYLDLGIVGTMVDFGDLLPDDAVLHDGRCGNQMHNLYAYDYHRLYRQLFEERRGSDHVLFSRSAAPGSQRWLGQFAGDHQANFTGLHAAMMGGLNLCACGFSAWGCDIGGYMGWPDPETYIRWVQWGCLSPIMRCHGTEPREPWEYGEEAVTIYAFYAWLRENLLEYLYAAAMEAHETGVPMMRAMPFAFPGDATAADCDDEYMLGPDLLVAPVHAGDLRRPVRFPEGRWTDFWTGEVVAGPQTRQVEAPLERIPLYLRAGAALPVHLHGTLQWGASMTGSRVGALVATPPGTGEFRIGIADAGVRYVLIYGAGVTAVSVNGRVLPRLEDKDVVACPPGWYADGTRFVVRLPEGLHREVFVSI